MADERTNANKAVIRRFYDEAVNKGNLEIVDEVYRYDVELHIPGIAEDPYGPGPIRQLYGTLLQAFSGIRVTIEDLVAEGDKVAARVTFHRPGLTHARPPSPYARFAAWTRLDVYHLFQGKVVEQWGDRDDLGVLEQLGVQSLPVEHRGQPPAQ